MIHFESVGRRCSSPAPACGFSLLELLAAMTVLSIVVAACLAVYVNVDKTWRLGTETAEADAAGRAALSAICRDLNCAVADDIFTFALGPDRFGSISYGVQNDEICFVLLTPASAEGTRSASAIHYWVRQAGAHRYELVRGGVVLTNGYDTFGADNFYRNRSWYEEAGLGGAGRPAAVAVVAQNVACLRFGAPSGDGSILREYHSVSNADMLPDFVDVYLEMLDGQSARQADEMAERGLDTVPVVERNIRRYSTRVYFYNREGRRRR